MSHGEPVFPQTLSDDAQQVIRARMVAKGLIMEPENEGEDLSYLARLFDLTCSRLDRETSEQQA
ncbi:hypothetical protein [Magnetospirillum moscoviense]|uniref:Uncharacterized protein n=1 Tax=Magnetospirillum moscoviense TaxID=1437059 RepID=A0A178MZU2_9PROT|nr:hypothetical protein [Magnetospirillum moscoviense]OAN56862.1 hypothetical protein A6A05_07785 [Magnetospirillum moscoviense]